MSVASNDNMAAVGRHTDGGGMFFCFRDSNLKIGFFSVLTGMAIRKSSLAGGRGGRRLGSASTI
jgi:hypothetical protein